MEKGSKEESPHSMRRVKSDLDRYRDVPYGQLEQDCNRYKTTLENLQNRYVEILQQVQAKNTSARESIESLAQELEDKTQAFKDAQYRNESLEKQLNVTHSFTGWCVHRVTRYMGISLMVCVAYKLLAMSAWKKKMKQFLARGWQKKKQQHQKKRNIKTKVS
jgi:Skp family chaperone for outer membrane proteins